MISLKGIDSQHSTIIDDINNSELRNIVTLHCLANSDSIEFGPALRTALLRLPVLLSFSFQDRQSVTHVFEDGQVQTTKYPALTHLNLTTCNWPSDVDQVSHQWNFSRLKQLSLFGIETMNFLKTTKASDMQRLRNFGCLDLESYTGSFDPWTASDTDRLAVAKEVLQRASQLPNLKVLAIRTNSPRTALATLIKSLPGLFILDLRLYLPPHLAEIYYLPTATLKDVASSFTMLTDLHLSFPWIDISCDFTFTGFYCRHRSADRSVRPRQWPLHLAGTRNLRRLRFCTESLCTKRDRSLDIKQSQPCYKVGAPSAEQLAKDIIRTLVSIKEGHPFETIFFEVNVQSHTKDQSNIRALNHSQPVSVEWECRDVREPGRGMFCTIYHKSRNG